MIEDPRFHTNPDRVANFSETVATVQAIVGARPRDEWVVLLTELSVPCAPINSLKEMLDDPHTKARGIVLDYDHPTLGPMKSIAHPIVFNGTVRTVGTAPPLHGEHTRRILAGVGYDDATIDAMAAKAVVVG